MATPTVHWLGAGLSSGPGILRIAKLGHRMILWNRTLERAQQVFDSEPNFSNVEIHALDQGKLAQAIRPGDILVSMLPAPMHPEFAKLCLEKKAHLVTTSYVSDAMRGFDAAAKAAGLCFINECGLDPGIDHMFAHLLVQDFRKSFPNAEGLELEFRSYCGGIPKIPNDFKYKFSWSPAGVLRALKNQARYIDQGDQKTVAQPWDVVAPYQIGGETFEVYPNRDSVQYLGEYHMDPKWKVKTFVRGTIRLAGWKQAWSSIFAMLPSASNEKVEEVSNDLWKQHAYKDGEQDRVVLFVELKASKNGKEAYKKHYLLDEAGTGKYTAMAKLVSLPATFAVEWILEKKAPQGVFAAPEDSDTIHHWLDLLKKSGIKVLQ